MIFFFWLCRRYQMKMDGDEPALQYKGKLGYLTPRVLHLRE